MIKSVENQDSGHLSPLNGRDGAQRSRGEPGFDDLLQVIAGGGGLNVLRDEQARQVAAVNRLALQNERLANDDLRLIDEELSQRDTRLGERHHALQRGATAAARGQLGMGRMSSVFGPSLAQASVLEQGTPAKTDPGAATLFTEGDAAPSGGKSARTTPDGHDTGRANGEQPAQRMQPLIAGNLSTQQRAAEPAREVSELLQHVRISKGQLALGARGSDVKPTLQSNHTIVSARPAHALLTSPSSAAGHSDAGDSALDPKTNSRPAPNRAVPSNSSQSGAAEKPQQHKVIDDVLRIVRSRLGQRSSSIKVQLSPPELGKLTIDMQVKNEQLRIEIRAETHQVRELLQGNSSVLRDALSQEGLLVEHFEVRVQEPVEVPTETVGQDAEVEDGEFSSATQARDHDPAESEQGQTTEHGADSEDIEAAAGLLANGHVDIKA